MRRSIIVSGLGLALFGCLPPTSHSCEDTLSCGAAPATGGGGSGGGAAGGTGGAPGEGGASGASGGAAGAGGGDCEASAAPWAGDACAASDAVAVFVSAAAVPGGDGTRGAPYRTLGDGVAAAIAQDKRVYVCATGGPYRETVRMDATAVGLEVYGGFDCETWEYSTSLRARVVSSEPRAWVAVGADGLALYDLEVAAGPGTEAEPSSVALTLAGTDATLTRVRLVAGAGRAGTAGALAPYGEGTGWPTIAELAGSNGTSASGGGVCRYDACDGGGETVGGVGGDPRTGGEDGDAGTAVPAPSVGGMGLGGLPGGTCVDGLGRNGAAGAAGRDGAGATTYGTLSDTGEWVPAPGEDGVPGGPGQGGGGGASLSTTGGGGGGGCGACGGAGAARGTGGGSSLALVVVDSTVTLTTSELVTGDAGAGGAARDGQAGQRNGALDVGGEGGVQGSNACAGGAGGPGGPGGAAGGGAGGLSVGVLYRGLAPELDAATEAAVATGIAGPGGAGVVGKPTTQGRDGVRAAVMAVE